MAGRLQQVGVTGYYKFRCFLEALPPHANGLTTNPVANLG